MALTEMQYSRHNIQRREILRLYGGKYILFGRCLRPALSAHTPTGVARPAGIRFYR